MTLYPQKSPNFLLKCSIYAKISFLYDFTKFFISCLLSFTIIFFPVVRVITVSGVSSITSKRLGFTRIFAPLIFVTSITPFSSFCPFSKAFHQPTKGRKSPSLLSVSSKSVQKNYLFRLVSSSNRVSETVIIRLFAWKPR